MYTTESEVEINTSTNVSCVVYGLSKQLDSVKWEKPNFGGVITDGTDGYKIDVGTYEDYGHSGSQESVLTIPASEVKADSNFTCVVESLEHGIDGEFKEDANLFVFSKYNAMFIFEVLMPFSNLQLLALHSVCSLCIKFDEKLRNWKKVSYKHID